MPPKGQFFYIKSYLNGFVLDIEGGSTDEGAKVIMYEAKPLEEADNQLWYMDNLTSTIRSVLHDYCLDVADDRLCVNPYRDGDKSQMWAAAGHFILNMDNPGEVLDVVGNNEDEGAEVTCYQRHGAPNQRWYFEHAVRKYFYVTSQMHGKVLDVRGNDDGPGAEVILWERKDDPADNQLWYAGRDGLIRSKLNDFVLDSGDDTLKLQPLDVRAKSQGFVYSHHTLRNLHNRDRVVDISSNNEDDGATCCEWDYHGNSNQMWNLSYIYV